ncbi:MAG: DUF4864 domain-containing protein [Rhodobacteraceae bacterium]|nr:DUF4864 domain-containing protein [Paracoccaceae bacterium]
MRLLSVLHAAALALAVLPSAAPADEADAPAIRGVIRSQVDAFLREDAATAFTFASPTIRGIFGTPDAFGLMVRRGYPMIWAPESVEFLGLREVAGRPYQRVLFRDAAGAIFLFDYEMVKGPDGWKINGVFPVAPDAAGA